MATNNMVNLKDSGICYYDGAGTFSALANPLTVANGGTADSSLTAYAVITGGTSSTNPVQSIASVGTSGQVLKSNGAGALPSFGTLTLTPKYLINTYTISADYSDSDTFYMRYGGEADTSIEWATAKLYIPIAGTITAAYGAVTITGTLGSAQNVAIYVRKNNTTDTAITAASQWTANPTLFSNAGLSIAVSAGDYVSIKFVTPVWTTNPTNVELSVSLVIT